MSKNEFLKTMDKTIEKYAEKGTETLASILGKKNVKVFLWIYYKKKSRTKRNHNRNNKDRKN